MRLRALALTSFLCLGTMLAAIFLPKAVAETPTRHNCFPDQGGQHLATIIFDPQPVVSAKQGEDIRERLMRLYASEVGIRGSSIHIFETDDMQFAAYAARGFSGEYSVEIFKGVRYHRLMTPDVYAMIVCHEIGHHLGGFPEKRGSSWAAVEGQADYYANLKCLRRYFEDGAPGNEKPVYTLDMVDQCSKAFSTPSEKATCLRGMQAARDLGAVVGDLDGGPVPPDLSTMDSSEVAQTLDSYPSPQCRLDTFRAGALCPVQWQESLSAREPGPGACGRQKFPQAGRPACWYSANTVGVAL